MKLNDKKAIREKSVGDLQKEISALKKEYVVAKMQFKVGKLSNPKLLSSIKRKVALISTVVTEKQNV